MWLIVANIIRIIAAVFDIMAASTTETKKIYLYNGIYNFLLGVQYYILNAISGAISSFVAILRNIIFHRHRKYSIYALIPYLIFVVVINIPAYEGIISTLPIIMVFMYTIAIYRVKIMEIKYVSIITCALEIIYDIYYHAYIGALVCVMYIIVVIISIIRIKRRQLKTN